MVQLFSDRLVIRDYVITDLNNHHELLSDSIVMYYLQDIKTNCLEESKENLMIVLNDQKLPDRKRYHFVIEKKMKMNLLAELDIL